MVGLMKVTLMISCGIFSYPVDSLTQEFSEQYLSCFNSVTENCDAKCDEDERGRFAFIEVRQFFTNILNEEEEGRPLPLSDETYLGALNHMLLQYKSKVKAHESFEENEIVDFGDMTDALLSLEGIEPTDQGVTITYNEYSTHVRFYKEDMEPALECSMNMRKTDCLQCVLLSTVQALDSQHCADDFRGLYLHTIGQIALIIDPESFHSGQIDVNQLFSKIAYLSELQNPPTGCDTIH